MKLLKKLFKKASLKAIIFPFFLIISWSALYWFPHLDLSYLDWLLGFSLYLGFFLSLFHTTKFIPENSEPWTGAENSCNELKNLTENNHPSSPSQDDLSLNKSDDLDKSSHLSVNSEPWTGAEKSFNKAAAPAANDLTKDDYPLIQAKDLIDLPINDESIQSSPFEFTLEKAKKPLTGDASYPEQDTVNGLDKNTNILLSGKDSGEGSSGSNQPQSDKAKGKQREIQADNGEENSRSNVFTYPNYGHPADDGEASSRSNQSQSDKAKGKQRETQADNGEGSSKSSWPITDSGTESTTSLRFIDITDEKYNLQVVVINDNDSKEIKKIKREFNEIETEKYDTVDALTDKINDLNLDLRRERDMNKVIAKRKLVTELEENVKDIVESKEFSVDELKSDLDKEIKRETDPDSVPNPQTKLKRTYSDPSESYEQAPGKRARICSSVDDENPESPSHDSENPESPSHDSENPESQTTPLNLFQANRENPQSQASNNHHASQALTQNSSHRPSTSKVIISKDKGKKSYSTYISIKPLKPQSHKYLARKPRLESKSPQAHKSHKYRKAQGSLKSSEAHKPFKPLPLRSRWGDSRKEIKKKNSLAKSMLEIVRIKRKQRDTKFTPRIILQENNLEMEKTTKEPEITIVNNLGLPRQFLPATKEWFNSIYSYSRNEMRSIRGLDLSVSKLIKIYFTSIPHSFYLTRKRKRLKNLKTNKVYLSKLELKHTSSKVTIILYLFADDNINLSFLYKFTNNENFSLSMVKKAGLLGFKNFIDNYFDLAKTTEFIKKTKKSFYDYIRIDNKVDKMINFLVNKISKFYKKKVEINIIRLKYLYLNNKMIAEYIALKLIKKKRNLFRAKRKLFKKIKFPYINKYAINNITLASQNIIKKSFRNQSRAIRGKQIWDEWKQDKYFRPVVHSDQSRINDTYRDFLQSINYKFPIGIRLGIAGRLTKRNVAARSIKKYTYIGSLKNIDSSFRSVSVSNLRSCSRPNLEYNQKNSLARTGAFTVRSWLGNY